VLIITKYNSKEFARRLTEAREKRQLTQLELANAIGTHLNVIWQYENEKRVPSLNNVYKIAKVLDVDIDYLAGLDETMPEEIMSPAVLISNMRSFMFSPSVIDADKDLLFKKTSDAYWKYKTKASAPE
jgi:transcriptional regulator with XRE-family HTH domain